MTGATTATGKEAAPAPTESAPAQDWTQHPAYNAEFERLNTEAVKEANAEWLAKQNAKVFGFSVYEEMGSLASAPAAAAQHPPASQVDSLDALQALAPKVGRPIVLQFGSERCAHCPQTTLRLSQLTADYTFEWVYKDVSADLCEEFQITRLPALVIWSGPEAYSVHEGLRGAQADSIIKDCCWPRKVELDADF